VAYQYRPLSDILFPRTIRLFRDIGGDFWFTLTAKAPTNSGGSTPATDCVHGKVHIFKSDNDWNAFALHQMKAIIQELGDCRFDPSCMATRAACAFNRATTLVEKCADIHIEFHLYRDGEVYFCSPSFANQDFRDRSENFAATTGHNITKWIADQCYFFLRDLTHTHQHHEPSSDTILILQERGDDDVQWRNNIIYSLHYAIIRFKRYADSKYTLRATGILGYCKSFMACCERKASKTNIATLAEFNCNDLLLSLHAKSQESSADEQTRSNSTASTFAKVNAWRTYTLAIAAILITILPVFVSPRIPAEDKEPFRVLYRLSVLATTHFLEMVSVIGIVTWLVWLFTSLYANARFRSTSEASYILIPYSTIFFLIASLLIAGFSLWMFAPAVLGVTSLVSDLVKLLSQTN